MENRVVFDTNIWISKIITGTLPTFVAWIFAHHIQALRSERSTDELYAVLSRKKFEKHHIDVQANMEVYKALCKYCNTKTLFTDCVDVNDNFLFDLAIQGKAQYIVSSDKIVLATPLHHRKLQLLTFTQFKTIIG
ncbi:MAG: putative toxin-antitoxin system toxin component, PIN family [Bacteroidales bacterium]|jgi:putative PIN family toxin of toxin-antitoxin system|nr:putative toxin-antitoxin system toxin component, PIN family [Bacteroidales bacterium]